MSTNDQLSKRARQKARRDAQRAAQQAAAARARRNRLLALLSVALLVLAGVGVAVQRQLAARAAVQQERAEVAARLTSLRCTQDTAQPDFGGGSHLDVQGAQNVAANPPEAIYPDRPATSGPHISSVVRTGVYDTLIDERILVHNLEHGYIVAYYAPSAPADQVTALKDWARAQIDAGFSKLVVAPWTGPALTDDANFAYTAWNFRQLCGQFDPQVANLFTTSHSAGNSRAPERDLAPHVGTQAGIYDPSTSNLLFPPLDQQLGDGRPNLVGEATPSPTPAPSPSS